MEPEKQNRQGEVERESHLGMGRRRCVNLALKLPTARVQSTTIALNYSRTLAPISQTSL